MTGALHARIAGTPAAAALMMLLLVSCGDAGAPAPDVGVESDAAERDARTPDGGADAADATAPLCGDERKRALVYYGTAEPSFLPLQEGQLLALGRVAGCTATVLDEAWIITARHCGVGLDDSFCVGADLSSPVHCFALAEVREHPALDLTLARLQEQATVAVPGLVPIATLTVEMDAAWVGRTAEAAGYGITHESETGLRRSVAEPIVELDPELMVVDGMGERGLCRGDSGGPVMVLADDGTVRVAGVLSFGERSCTGCDSATRIDVRREWIEGWTGPTVVAGARCGGIDATGRCVDGAAVYCRDGAVTRDACGDGSDCGWDGEREAFRCIGGEDPCGGVDGFGECEGQVARWCDEGVVRERDCGECGTQRCAIVAEVGGVYCEPDPCAELGFRGRCNGDIAEWCEGGVFRSLDCAARGERCGEVEGLGYFCTD